MPEEVALLLLSHDEIFSELSHVPISGIIHPCEQIGHQAAAMLDELMAADSRTKKTEKSRSVPQLLLDPVGIKTRQSSDVLAVSDTVLQKAIAYIRAHPESPLQVNHVASHVGISRRALEQKFSRYLNGTPAEYIRSAHLQKAKELLRETSLTIPEVAAQTGFTSPEYFSQYFKIQMGTTPLRYRKRQAAR
jgi:LacI family transcriptional regulator